MSLNDVFDHLKKSFTIRKRVDFSEANIYIELETPTALEEIKITEACKDLEGTSYLEGLKKHSLAYAIKRIKTPDTDIEIDNDMELEWMKEDGSKELVSKYLYLLKQLESWPSALRDKLFDAFSNLQDEVEQKVEESIKFELFKSSTIIEDIKEKESEFKKIDFPDDEDDMTEVEKISKHAREEIDAIDSNTYNKEQDKINKING